ncbi:hypothetical protein SHIRM173S_08898 [Streptomyces hirsutus]
MAVPKGCPQGRRQRRTGWAWRASPGRPPAGPGTYHGGMSFLRRRSATPAGPDFDVLAMDPGDWPGNLGAGLLPAPDGTCQGVFLRYDLFGGRGPAMIISNAPEGSPSPEVPEGEVPLEVGQLLLALENDEEVTVVGTEDVPVMQGDNLLIVRRVKLSESRISCVQFDRSDQCWSPSPPGTAPSPTTCTPSSSRCPPNCSSRADRPGPALVPGRERGQERGPELKAGDGRRYTVLTVTSAARTNATR